MIRKQFSTLVRRLSVLFLLAGSATLASGQDFSQLMQVPLPLDTAVRYGKLENGMTYYIRYNAQPKQRAEFYILHNVGAILEEDDQNGLAHFTEHMAFNGTTHFPDKQLISFLEHNGVKFGADVNAFTSQDMTCYNISDVPTTRTGLLDSCVLVLCDWSGDITFDPKEVDAEREVISEEWRTRRTPEWRAQEARNQVLYRGSKYAERDVIGPLSVIQNFEYQSIKDFYHKWYRPEFQAMIIVGDFDVDEMEARVKRMAGALPKRDDKVTKPMYHLQPTEGIEYGSFSDPEISNTRIDIVYKHPPRAEQPKTLGYFRQTLVYDLAVQMLNARFLELAQQPDKPFAMGQSAYMQITASSDIFYLIGLSMPGEVQKTLNGLLTETQRVRQNGFVRSELDRAKADYLRAVTSRYDERNKQRNSHYVWQYIWHFARHTPAPPIDLEMQLTQLMMETIEVEEVNALAEHLLDGEDAVVFVTTPASEKATIPTQESVEQLFSSIYNSDLEPWEDNFKSEPLITDQPKAGRVVKERRDKKFNSIRWELSNGATVILKPTDFKDDEVMLVGVAPGGLSLVPDAALPSASVAAEIASMSGLGNFDAMELQKALAGKDVRTSASIGNYESEVSGQSSAKIEELELFFQLIYLHFTAPRFDQKGYENFTHLMRTAFQNRLNDPDYIFQKKFVEEYYANNPRRFVPSIELLDKITLEQAAKAYNDRFSNARNFTFVITGNINPQEIRPFVELYIASLPQGVKETWKDDGARPRTNTHRSEFSQKMNTPKSTAMIAWFGEAGDKLADYVAARALKQILDLRSTEEVREEAGGTYGVSTYLMISQRPSPYSEALFHFDTDPEKLDDLVPIVESIFERLRYDIKNEDVEKTKKNLLKSYEDLVRRNAYWLNVISRYEQTGVDMYTNYEKEVNKLNAKSLEKAAQKFFGKRNRLDLFMRGYK